MPYYKGSQGSNPMFRIQILWQGQWENTVYHPMAEQFAVSILENLTYFNPEHTYRIVEA